MPVDNPAAVRIALAGSSVKYAVSKLELPDKLFIDDQGKIKGVRGALSWQPTFLFDDQMWFTYAIATKCQHMYQPFGLWCSSLAEVSTSARKSISRKMQESQVVRQKKNRQQAGNRKRRQETQDRRNKLLAVARPLWDQIEDVTPGTRGRPGHRKQLAEMLKQERVVASTRDIKWLMQQLSSSPEQS